MSKAFTRESDEAAEEKISPARVKLVGEAAGYMTRHGVDRLVARLNDLVKQRDALGDGEGGEVQRAIDFEIQKVRWQLDSALIAEPPGGSRRSWVWGLRARAG